MINAKVNRKVDALYFITLDEWRQNKSKVF